MEGAAAPARRRLAGRRTIYAAPRHAQQVQAVQQVAALQIERLAQIEVEQFLGGFGSYFQAHRLALKVLLQGRHGCLRRHAAQPVAND